MAQGLWTNNPRNTKTKGEGETYRSVSVYEMYRGLFILILFSLKLRKLTKIIRGHNFTLVKEQSRVCVRKYSFSHTTINVWNKLSTFGPTDLYVQEKNRPICRKGGLHLE